MSEYLCPCQKVKKSDIKKAVKDGAADFKEVKKITKVATGCGKCKKKAKKVTKKYLKKFGTKK